MGHCQNQKEIDDKYKWLDLYYPSIKERLFTHENISKADTIIEYCKNNNIPLNEIIYVDDIIA